MDVRLVDFGSAFVLGAGGKGEPKENSGTVAYRCVRVCVHHTPGCHIRGVHHAPAGVFCMLCVYVFICVLRNLFFRVWAQRVPSFRGSRLGGGSSGRGTGQLTSLIRYVMSMQRRAARKLNLECVSNGELQHIYIPRYELKLDSWMMTQQMGEISYRSGELVDSGNILDSIVVAMCKIVRVFQNS